jgi:hypothetical protein
MTDLQKTITKLAQTDRDQLEAICKRYSRPRYKGAAVVPNSLLGGRPLNETYTINGTEYRPQKHYVHLNLVRDYKTTHRGYTVALAYLEEVLKNEQD